MRPFIFVTAGDNSQLALINISQIRGVMTVSAAERAAHPEFKKSRSIVVVEGGKAIICENDMAFWEKTMIHYDLLETIPNPPAKEF